MKLIDSHCHIFFDAYDADREEVWQRAEQEGIGMIVVGTDFHTSQQAVESVRNRKNAWATVGVHPTDCSSELDSTALETLAREPKVVAIGECGLDFFHLPRNEEDCRAAIEKQIILLRAQIDLAARLNLPIVLHCRDAHNELIEILFKEAHNVARRGVIHCFTGTVEQARKYVELGFYISFSGVITFPPRKTEGLLSAVQIAARDLPLDRLLVETDAPFLAPQSHRGERNESAYVVDVAKKIAELKGLDIEEVARLTTQTTQNLFGL